MPSSQGPGPWGTNRAQTRFCYAYDAKGNRMTMKQIDPTAACTSTSGTITNYAYDASTKDDRLCAMSTSIVPTCASSPSSTTTKFTYNGLGEMTQRANSATTTYAFDMSGLMTRLVAGASTYTFVYDALGRRVKTTEPSGQNTLTTYSTFGGADLLFTYAGTSPSTMATTILRLTYGPSVPATTTYGYSGDGMRTTVSATGVASKNFGYDVASGLPQPTGEFSGGSLRNQTLYDDGTNGPLERVVGSTGYYVHADGLGSVTSITNASQGLQSSYQYDAYGRPIQAAGFVPSPYGYTGSESDANDGLVYDRARYYDPTTGRFLSRDPLGGGYVYAGDSPTNFVDPTGMKECSAGGCWYHGPPPPPPPPSSIPSSESASAAPKWQTLQCYLADALFVIGVVLSILGLWADEGTMVRFGAAVSGLSMAADIQSTIEGWEKDPLGLLGALLDFAWVFITSVYIPALSIWDAALAGISILPRITPPGFAASVGIAVVTNVLAFAGLAAAGCVPP